MQVLITGDSHTAALYQGQQAIEVEAAWPSALDLLVRPLGGGHLTRKPFFVDRGDHAEITAPEYRRHFDRFPLVDAAGADTIYGISAPLHSVRLWRHVDWRRFAPIGLPSCGLTVSSGMLKRLVLDDQQYVLGLIRILLRSRKRVFVIEPPHPFRHHPALRGTSPETVLHLNALYREIVRRELEDIGVPIVAVPEHCLDAGFMRPEYVKAGDPHHGNAHYGRVMMMEILKFLAEWRPVGTMGSKQSEPA